MWSYLRNQRSKQTNLVDLQFLLNYALFSKNSCRELLKKTSNMKVYYIIQLNYQLTEYPENFKIKLYYFQERLSLRYNIILKLLSLFHIVIN